MSGWAIYYTDQAKADLRNIYSYIAYSLLVPETAKNYLERIMDSVESLSDMPLRNPLYEKEPWRSRGLRKLVIDNYIAFYLPIEAKSEVVILSIMYGGRKIEEWLPKE